MIKYIWLTDIHLNFLNREERICFYQGILNENSDAILLSGDIAEAPTLTLLLTEMANAIQKPIYFVLGNHDYYHSTVADVRKAMAQITNSNKWLKWLPACKPVLLDQDTYLIGQDGWADGRYGDYGNSPVSLNDSLMIVDLFQQKIIGKNALLAKMQQLADEDANKLLIHLEQVIAIPRIKKIIILTHIPPFKETCKHDNKISNDDWLPFFSSKATGDVLIEIAAKNSNIEFMTYCGHTHSPALYQPLKNLTIRTGKAQYYMPEIQKY